MSNKKGGWKDKKLKKIISKERAGLWKKDGRGLTNKDKEVCERENTTIE